MSRVSRLGPRMPPPPPAGAARPLTQVALQRSAPASLRTATPPPLGGPPRIARSELFTLPIPTRRLPSPAEALADPTFPSLRPSEVDVLPPGGAEALDHVARLIARGQRILVVSHVRPPDGDCVGAAAGLSRGLRALGLDATACVDDELPANLARIGRGDVHRWAELEGTFDTVVLVDVAAEARIGGAKEALANAHTVVAIDHHDVSKDPLCMPGKKGGSVAQFIDLRAEAACLQVGRVLEVLEGLLGRTISAAARGEVYAPLAAGIFTDTGGFRHEGTRRECLSVFKHLLGGDEARLSTLVEKLTVELPSAVQTHLNRKVRVEERRSGPARSALLTCEAATFARAVEIAQRSDDSLGAVDLRGTLFDRLDAAREQKGLAVLLFEEPDGVRVSIRSRTGDDAIDLARLLGGGGKPGAGAAFLAGASPEAARAQVLPLIEGWHLKEEARARGAGRGP